MSWFLLNRNLTPLEPYDWKLSRTVLRGERGSNAPDLPGKALSSANMAEYLRYMYKTVRKYYGEAIVVTQEVDNPSRLYKEVWIGLGGTQSAVYATEVSAEEYLAYTTEETEKVEVYRLAEKLGGDIEAAIRELAERRRNKE